MNPLDTLELVKGGDELNRFAVVQQAGIWLTSPFGLVRLKSSLHSDFRYPPAVICHCCWGGSKDRLGIIHNWVW
jgi:hypothetical protein